jgi:hypothetical protein
MEVFKIIAAFLGAAIGGLACLMHGDELSAG